MTPYAPRVLVLLASHNGERWIEQQLSSIQHQEGVQVTLLVRDDRSTDATKEVVARAISGFVQATLVLSTDSGGSAAKNFFALFSLADVHDYDYISLADQDDIWLPKKLLRGVERLKSTGASGYSTAVEAFWEDGRTQRLSQSPRQRLADYVFEGAGQGCTFMIAAAFFRRCQKAFAKHPEMIEALHYHDWALYALCRALGESWCFDTVPGVHYRQHADNDTGARSSQAGRVKRLTQIRNGWYGKQVTTVARLCVAVAGAPAVGAQAVLQILAIQNPLARRLAFTMFVLKNGRRRPFDRLVLAWATLFGHLS